MISPKVPVIAAAGGILIAAATLSTMSGILATGSPPPIGEATQSELTHRFSIASHFVGTYTWDDSTIAQRVALDVAQVKRSDDGTLVGTGRGTYDDDAHFTFRIELDPRTGAFTMVESEPSVADFITAGRHEGRLTPSGDVHARWIGADGMYGTLAMEPVLSSARLEPASPTPGLKAPSYATEIGGGTRMAWLRTARTDACVDAKDQQVTVHYTGWNEDGILETSRNREWPVTFTVNRVIPGFGAAMERMCVGDTVRVWVPASEGNGDRATAGRKGGDLVFDIELIELGGLSH